MADQPRQNSPAEVVSLVSARLSREAQDTTTIAGLAAVYEAAGCHRDHRAHRNTWAGYQTALRAFGAVRLPGEAPRWIQRGGLKASPTLGDVQVFVRQLRDVKGLKPTTVNTYLDSVRSIARKAGHIAGDDTRVAGTLDACDRLPVETPSEREIAPADVGALLVQLENQGEFAFAGLVALCGLRPGEVMSLLPEDFNPGAKKVMVHAGSRASRERKNHRPRTLYLDTQPEVFAALVWLLEHRLTTFRPQDGRKERACDRYLFPVAKAWQLSFYARLRALAGVNAERWFPKGVSCLYSTRHAGASVVAEETGDREKVGAWAGDRSDRVLSYMRKARRGLHVEADVMGRVRKAVLVPAQERKRKAAQELVDVAAKTDSQVEELPPLVATIQGEERPVLLTSKGIEELPAGYVAPAVAPVATKPQDVKVVPASVEPVTNVTPVTQSTTRVSDVKSVPAAKRRASRATESTEQLPLF